MNSVITSWLGRDFTYVLGFFLLIPNAISFMGLPRSSQIERDVRNSSGKASCSTVRALHRYSYERRQHYRMDSGRALSHTLFSLEANEGQFDPRIRFLSRGNGHNFLLTVGEVLLILKKEKRDERRLDVDAPIVKGPKAALVSMRFVGANPKPSVRAVDQLTPKTNYFVGNDPTKWRAHVRSFAKVEYSNIYPDIDLIYRGTEDNLDYDFVVAPRANPNLITHELAGINGLEIDPQGDLLLKIGDARLRQLKPFIYQEVNGERRPIPGGYVLKGKNRFGFQVGPYDHNKPLVIDPVLVFSTYLGGLGADVAAAVTTDFEGNAYVVGTTDSLNFPTSVGAYQATRSAGKDVFVTKLKPNGTGVVYSTYIGGSLDDYGYKIAVDGAGNAYVTGTTTSTNFPTTPGALQTVNGGGTDAFVVKLNPTGSARLYSTYLGGNGNEEGFGIAVNSSGNAFVTGVTGSANFPVTSGAMQTAFGGSTDAFVTKLNPAGAAAIYSTYLGGSGAEIGYGIALDSSGDNAHVTGVTGSINFPTTLGAFRSGPADNSDAFVTRLNPAGSAATYSTLIGGSTSDAGFGITVDTQGNAYVTGATDSPDFTTTNGVAQAVYGGGDSDAFVTKLNASGTAPVYSTYLGGSGADTGVNVALDYNGDAYVAGTTNSTNFPVTSGAPQSSRGGGNDAFLAKLNSAGSARIYSTFIGGAQDEEAFGLAINLAKDAYVTGSTFSANLPTTAGAYQAVAGGSGDAFITKVANVSTATPIDDAQYFVQQHYLDFLSRTPDASGLAFWTNEIASCGTNSACIDLKRINVSAAYFLSIEFQQTGYLVERIYKAAYGDGNGTSTIGGAHQLAVPVVRFGEFLPDTQKIGQGVIVGQAGWETVLENNKQAFANEFVQRSRFTAALPTTMTPAQFVDKLFTNAGVTPTSSDRTAVINEFGSATTTSDVAARARALRDVAENATLNSQEFNRAFVLMQFFGYLRRDPNSGQDIDYTGYDFWLTKLNIFNGNFVNAEMVKAFITSGEYRQRFGP